MANIYTKSIITKDKVTDSSVQYVEYTINLLNKSNIVVNIKFYGEPNHIFQGVLSLEPLDKVSLIYNTGKYVVAEFISKYSKKKEIYYVFLINKKIVSFKQIEIPKKYENVGYTYSVNNTKYALCLVDNFN